MNPYLCRPPIPTRPCARCGCATRLGPRPAGAPWAGQHLCSTCVDDPETVLGPAQDVSFTERDGTVTTRRMRPVIDQQGSWLRWVEA